MRKILKATNDIRLYVHYQCIHLYLSGESRNRIAEILILNLETIGNYIQAYCSEGLERLFMDHSPGRPRRLTPEQEQELCQVIVNKKKLHHHEIARILFEDECMIRDYQALSNTWFPTGQQKRTLTYGQHRGAKLMDTIDYETGEIYVEVIF